MQRRLKMAMKRTKYKSKGGTVRRMRGGGMKMTKTRTAKKGGIVSRKRGRMVGNGSKMPKYRSRGGRAR